MPFTLDVIDLLEARFAAREPLVQAFVPEAGRFDRLRREAEALRRQYPDPDARPALFGVLVGVKDIFQAEGFVTRAGSRLPPELLQGPQADSVTRMKQAGALIVGKTVTTEFAYFAPGPTRNPHDPAHTPGGSSSGSAAAVAAGLCELALGTQTIGSILRPAAFCGVVGFKPSYDRIDRAGVIPLSPSLDHVGLFAADVAGVEAAAAVLCRDWQAALPDIAQRRPVLGVPDGPYLDQADEAGRMHFAAACGRLMAAGYSVRRVPALADFEALRDRHSRIVAAEAARVHAEWFARYENLYHSKTAELIRRGQAIPDVELEQLLPSRERLRAELQSLLDAHRLDVWIAPAAPGPAPRGLDSTGDPVMNLPWTHSGLPALGLPSGRSDGGLPLGLQVIGRWRADEALVAQATSIEAILAREAVDAVH